MASIVKSPRAKRDLLEIWEYIADDSEARADEFIVRFDTKFRLLAERSGLGRPREELAEGLRSFPLGRYVIFFRPVPKGVEIIRVLHSARDLNTGFFIDEDDEHG